MMRSEEYAFKLLALNVVVFALELAYPWIVPAFGVSLANALSGPWTLITSMFMHADLEHLLYNMFALGLFGFILERIIGSKSFLKVYFCTGICAAVTSVFAYPYSLSLGASGATMGIIGTLAFLRPRMMVYWGGAPLPMAFLAFMWIFGDLVGVVGPPDNIGHYAHIAGFFVGALMAYYWRKRYAEEKMVEEEVEDEFSDRELEHWEKEHMRS